MGEHKGWWVRSTRYGTAQAGVRLGSGYKTKTFATAALARAWARSESSGVRLGRTSRALLMPNQVMAERLAEDYLADLTARGRSPNHLRDVRLILRSLAKAVPCLTSESAAEDIERWVNTLRTTGKGRGGKPGAVSPARRNKYLMTVRGLCRWALRRKRMPEDPTLALELASVPDYLKPQLSIEECRRLAGHGRDSKTWRWAILMLYAGLRSDEARCLRWGDVDWAGKCLFVRLSSGAAVKRQRERIVPMQPELQRLLEPLQGGSSAAISGLGKANLGRSFADLLTACKITADGLSPHSLRHTYAGVMTATGEPTALVGAYLGHTEAKTTMGYTKLAVRYVSAVSGWPRGEMRLLS